MCGIVAAISTKNISSFLIEGLSKLEYRGYDSAGLAVIDGGLKRLRNAGRVAQLANQVKEKNIEANIGIAHTRWATHGEPSERNAHPHVSKNGIALVHNGIIENFEQLRRELQKDGVEFSSDTDSEVIAHLIDKNLSDGKSLLEAVRESIKELRGAFALAILFEQSPSQIVLARRGAPLIIGVGQDALFCASDASALLHVTKKLIYLEDGDLVDLKLSGMSLIDEGGEPVFRDVFESEISSTEVELGQYQHFMQKEIFEQPGALGATLETVTGTDAAIPGMFGVEAENTFREINSVQIVACGTSFHAGLTAKYWLEEIAKIPTNVDIASEYRYRKPIGNKDCLFIVISQSGETADTIAALEYAKRLGHDKTLAICNVPESSIIRLAKLKFLTRAGPEIGVASTKAFTTQLAALFLLAAVIAKVKQQITIETEKKLINDLRHLPLAVNHVLELEQSVANWAKVISPKKNVLFLGRGVHYPIALEGALKLKEISYIHAEGYAAGELKHGPLALVDKDTPVIAVAPNDSLLEKLKSNLSEVKARGGELFVFADVDSVFDESDGINIIKMVEHAGHLSPILHTIPLQLLAYHVALQKGTDVDKPRNLAKSVTVE
jgi:glucosamine--fructose-6-phosphate aminotransferase (isomerizing)